jgi:hypothetical protein
MKQIKDFPQLTIASNDDLILTQSDGITQHINRGDFLADVMGNGNVLPIAFSHWHDESIVESGRSIRTDINYSLTYSLEIYQNPASLNDSFSFYRLLEAGNYRISVLTVKSTNVGKLKLEVDGILAFDDLDLYSASLIANATLTRDITVPTSGLHKFKWTIYSKNPSSTNYYFSGRKIWGVKI